MPNKDEPEATQKESRDTKPVNEANSEGKREVKGDEALELAVSRGFAMLDKHGNPKTPSKEDLRKRIASHEKNNDTPFFGLRKSPKRGKYIDCGEKVN